MPLTGPRDTADAPDWVWDEMKALRVYQKHADYRFKVAQQVARAYMAEHARAPKLITPAGGCGCATCRLAVKVITDNPDEEVR